jgi:hypothetical protein
VSQIGIDTGRGNTSLTATSPNIIDGDSPRNAATLCTVAGKVEDYNGLQRHFGRFLQAFFPDAADASHALVDLRL